MTCGDVTANVPNPINGILFKLFAVDEIRNVTSCLDCLKKHREIQTVNEFNYEYNNILLL